VAIGNPFGLGQTVTSGIISAMGRSGLGIEGYEDFIQTDASINPGNSGGALVNLKGELIGINTAILSRSGGNIGIGFAIPITMAEKVMKQLIEHGEIRRGRLGIYIQNLTPDLARAFGIKIDHGAVVSQVSPKSSAEKAGIKSGDVITAVNGTPIRNASALRNMIGLLPIGQKVDLELIRDGKKMNITAKIGEPQQEKQEAKELNKRLEGAVLGELDEGNPMYGKVHGVLVVDVTANSPAWVAGLRKGDIITSVNRIPVNNLAEMKSALNKGRNGILMNIRRGNGALFLLLQ
jgi:serine protease Do/serine protease DegQ